MGITNNEQKDFWVKCNVCKQYLMNHSGSTPCCGSIAYLVEDGIETKRLSLYTLVDLIFEEAIKLGKVLSNKMSDECDGGYVGETQDFEFEFDGKKYIATVDAFWESSNHFDLSVKGIDNDYYKYKCCNSF